MQKTKAHKVDHGAVRTAVTARAHTKTRAVVGKAIKHAAKKSLPKKNPVVVHQYGIVVRNNIGSQKAKGKKATTVKHTTIKRTTPKKAPTPVVVAATEAAKAVGAPSEMSKEFAALSVNSPIVTASAIPDANGAITMNVLPGSAVPWPPLPEETLVPEPDPVTDEDKKIRIVNDRQKQLQYAQQRQERANYLESQINIAAQHGYIIDPAEIQKRRKEISAIGINDPSTKRAAALVDKDILLKKDKPSHMQRNFNLLVAMVVILVFVALVTRGSNETPEEKAEKEKIANAAKNGESSPRQPVSLTVGLISIFMTVIATIISYKDWYGNEAGPVVKDKKDGVSKPNKFFRWWANTKSSWTNTSGIPASLPGTGGPAAQ